MTQSYSEDESKEEAGDGRGWPRFVRNRASVLSVVALLVALISLLGNVYLIGQLRNPARLMTSVSRSMGGDGTFTYEVRIPAGTPISANIPVNERFTISVDTVIPLNTTIRVPFDTPIGRRSVSLPIRANVPLRTRLPIEVRDTFRLRTETVQEIVFPLEIRLDGLIEALQGPAR